MQMAAVLEEVEAQRMLVLPPELEGSVEVAVANLVNGVVAQEAVD